MPTSQVSSWATHGAAIEGRPTFVGMRSIVTWGSLAVRPTLQTDFLPGGERDGCCVENLPRGDERREETSAGERVRMSREEKLAPEPMRDALVRHQHGARGQGPFDRQSGDGLCQSRTVQKTLTGANERSLRTRIGVGFAQRRPRCACPRPRQAC
jgi:hypothetical protein